MGSSQAHGGSWGKWREKAMCPKLRRQEKEFKSVKDGEEKKKKKREEREDPNQSGLHPGLQWELGPDGLDGRLESKNLGVWTKIWVSRSQRRDESGNPVELKASRKGSQSPNSGLRATCWDRWLGGKSGATSSCPWNWLYQGLSSHLDPAPWLLVPGCACWGFGPGSRVQKLASDFQIVTLPARGLVSTITHPTAWSLKPSTHSQSHGHCPVVSIILSLPPCHLCSHQTVPVFWAQFPPP